MDAQLTNVVNVELYEATGANIAATLDAKAFNSGAGFKEVIGTSGDDLVTIGAGFSGAIKVNIGTDGGGGDTVSAAGSAATVTVAASAGNVGANDTLTGGSDGGDVLLLTADGGAGASLQG